MQPVTHPTLVSATEADYPEVIDLANRAFRGTGPEASWNVENVIEGQRLDESLLREDLANHADSVLLIWRSESDEDRGALLGCVFLEPPSPASGIWASWRFSRIARNSIWVAPCWPPQRTTPANAAPSASA